jgi:hypothetical protein
LKIVYRCRQAGLGLAWSFPGNFPTRRTSNFLASTIHERNKSNRKLGAQ